MAGTAGRPGVQPTGLIGRYKRQAVRQALGRLYTLVGASPRYRLYADRYSKVPTCADRLLLVPTLGRAVPVCPALPWSAYVGPQLEGSTGMFRRMELNTVLLTDIFAFAHEAHS
jgi:hypothetical protein